MATYKVLQDIEAEDKLLGPLSLRQFIYAVIVVVMGYIVFRVFFIQPFLVIPFLPPMVLFGILAAPFGHDQSSEIWLLAKIRFILKPRLRTWDQSGLQQLVSITVPKKLIHNLTNGLDETQVKSRLEALAQTIDTHGWAVKGVDVNLYAVPAYAQQSSDRLLDASSVPNVGVAEVDVNPRDDILDAHNSPVAQQMGRLVDANDQAHRQAIMNRMEEMRSNPSLPAMQTPVAPQPPTPAMPHMPLPSATYGHTPVLQPQSSVPAAPQQPANLQPPTTVTPPAKPAILELASNDDLSVATIARQANKNNLDDGEVVISLR